MTQITLPILYTDNLGRAAFIDRLLEIESLSPTISLSTILPATGLQFRLSPPSVQNPFHCTARDSCQFVIVQSGTMRITLRDGSFRDFGRGEFFLSMDFLPENTKYDSNVHGHSSSECTNGEPLATLFVKISLKTAEAILGLIGTSM